MNETLSEFCCFKNSIPLFEAMENTFGNWPEWKKDHAIYVMAEESCKSDWIDYLLDEKKYRWLDVTPAAD